MLDTQGAEGRLRDRKQVKNNKISAPFKRSLKSPKQKISSQRCPGKKKWGMPCLNYGTQNHKQLLCRQEVMRFAKGTQTERLESGVTSEDSALLSVLKLLGGFHSF